MNPALGEEFKQNPDNLLQDPTMEFPQETVVEVQKIYTLSPDQKRKQFGHFNLLISDHKESATTAETKQSQLLVNPAQKQSEDPSEPEKVTVKFKVGNEGEPVWENLPAFLLGHLNEKFDKAQ